MATMAFGVIPCCRTLCFYLWYYVFMTCLCVCTYICVTACIHVCVCMHVCPLQSAAAHRSKFHFTPAGCSSPQPADKPPQPMAADCTRCSPQPDNKRCTQICIR